MSESMSNGLKVSRAVSYLNEVVDHMNSTEINASEVGPDHPAVLAAEADLYAKVGSRAAQFREDLPFLLAFIKMAVPMFRDMERAVEQLNAVAEMNA